MLGSRDQLCILPSLESEPSSVKNHMCAKLNQKRKKAGPNQRQKEDKKCIFNDMSKLKKEEFQEATVLDIEDLVRIGKTVGCCPYYASKKLAPEVDVIFMPYNYLLDFHILLRQDLDLENAIIIFDEAHNVQNTCQDAASAQLTTDEISCGTNEIKYVIEI